MEEATIEPVRADASAWRWLVQGARSAVLMRVDWTGLRATPALMAWICFLSLAVEIVSGRLFIDGPATFFWRSLGFGWQWSVVIAWASWMAQRRGGPGADASRQAVDAPTLFTLLSLQLMVFGVALACVYVPLYRSGLMLQPSLQMSGHVIAIAVFAWLALAQARVAWMGSSAAPRPLRQALAGLVVAMLAVAMFVMPYGFWQPVKPALAAARAETAAVPASAGQTGADDDADTDAQPEAPMLKLSQDVFESQQRLLAMQLDAIGPERPGIVDVYAITFAPYADVDVFMRESAVVAEVMQARFDTRGRTLQLVNNVATVDRLAWATPLNLKRSIDRIASRMNRDEDILFLHLSSHGGADGHLAAEFFPLTVDQLTPQLLRRWLDEAGVRNRVISISACFSGSWIAPLAGDDTLVMTAADADHTSYGCGSKSTLTFFGQAMYDEQLRHTWSFEQAHAASRKLIDQREHAAGKTDGYSNPQISVGVRIRERLKALEARLSASAAR